MRRRRILITVVLAGMGVLSAGAEAPDNVVDLLSGGDFVPSVADLDGVAGGGAEADLLDLAESAQGDVDDGLRLRAIAALALYPSGDTRAALAAIIAENSEGDGIETMYLRAAIASYAETAKAEAVDTIAPLLAHVDRDVRASAARALAASESVAAIPLLRNRLGKEEIPQVRLAISAAIRELSGIPLPN